MRHNIVEKMTFCLSPKARKYAATVRTCLSARCTRAGTPLPPPLASTFVYCPLERFRQASDADP